MTVLELPVVSEALRENPLGDPHERILHVVVPDDHDPQTPIPCVWWLSGYAGSGRQMLSNDLWQEGLEERLRRLRKDGLIGPLIVALPDAFTRLGGCQYLSSPAVGAYEQYLWSELPAALGARCAVARQAVAGKSSGGFGALLAAIRNPSLFDAVACHSGDMGFELSIFPELPYLMNAIRDFGSVEALLAAHAEARNRREGRWFGPLSMLALAAVFSPDETQPLGIGLPFETKTGRLSEAVLDRWRALDPVRLLESSEKAQAALKKMRLVFFDCGRRDEHFLHWGARQFADVLRRKAIPHEHEEFDGGHRSTSFRLDVSLPKIYAALAQ